MNGKKNYLVKFLIPIGLLLLWLVLLFLQIFLIEESFTLITHNYNRHIFNLNDKENIRDTTRLAAKFKSKDDYLGIVSINFNKRQKMQEGRVIFRIKEEGSAHWYYQNSYNAKEFNDLSFYPFGFPIINQSKGKNYVVEIELEKANQHNKYLQLNSFGPALGSHHKFPKGPLIENRNAFAAFLSKKLANIVESNYQVFASTIFLYPLIFYLLWKVAKNKHTRRGFLLLIVLTAFFDALFVPQFTDLAYLTISMLWILLLRKLDLSLKITFYVGFIMLVLCIISHITNNGFIAEKFGAWALMFMAVGLIMSIAEMIKTERRS